MEKVGARGELNIHPATNDVRPATRLPGSTVAEQVAHRFVVYGDVQVRAGDRHVGVAGGVANLGQGAARGPGRG